MTTTPLPGTIGWTDLTVAEADKVRDFYAAVTGWKPEPVAMGQYSDYNMTTSDGTPVAGVCHSRGGNAGLPPVWLIYIVVADLAASLEACRSQDGTVLAEPRSLGGGRFAVVRDPAGAAFALYQAG